MWMAWDMGNVQKRRRGLVAITTGPKRHLNVCIQLLRALILTGPTYYGLAHFRRPLAMEGDKSEARYEKAY